MCLVIIRHTCSDYEVALTISFSCIPTSCGLISLLHCTRVDQEYLLNIFRLQTQRTSYSHQPGCSKDIPKVMISLNVCLKTMFIMLQRMAHGLNCQKESRRRPKEDGQSAPGGPMVDPKNVRLESMYDHIGPSWSKSTQTLLTKQQIPDFASVGSYTGEPKVLISIRTSLKNHICPLALFNGQKRSPNTLCEPLQAPSDDLPSGPKRVTNRVPKRLLAKTQNRHGKIAWSDRRTVRPTLPDAPLRLPAC